MAKAPTDVQGQLTNSKTHFFLIPIGVFLCQERGNTFFEEGLRKRIGSTATPNNSSINSTASQNGFISRYLSNIHASDRLRVEETLWYVHFNDQDFLIYVTGLSQTGTSLTSSWQTFLTGILIRTLILHFQQWVMAMHADGFKEELKTDTRQME